MAFGRLVVGAFLAVFVAASAHGAHRPRPELRLGTQNAWIVDGGYIFLHSPDGRGFAVTTYDGEIDILDTDGPRVVRVIKTGEKTAEPAFLDEHTIAVGGKGGRIAVWDTVTGRRLREFHEGSEDITPLAVSRDGKRIAFSAFMSSVTVIDAVSGAAAARFGHGPDFSDEIMHLAFSPDGARLASAAFGGNITVWDLRRGVVLWTTKVRSGEQRLVSSGPAGPHYDAPEHVTMIVYAPDGKTILVDGPNDELLFLDAETGAVRRKIGIPRVSMGSAVEDAAFMPDGQSLIVGQASGDVRRLAVNDGHEMYAVRSAGRLDGLGLTADGGRIVEFENEGYVVLRDAATGKPIRDGMDRSLWSAEFTKDGKLMAAAANDETIFFYRMPEGKLVRRLEPMGEFVTGLRFAPDDRSFAVRVDDSVQVLDTATFEKRLEIDRPQKILGDFTYAPNGKSLFLADDGAIGEWDATTGAPLRSAVAFPGFFEGFALSDDGRYLASGSNDHQVSVWSRDTGKELFRKPEEQKPWHDLSRVFFLPGGREVVGMPLYPQSMVRISLPDGAKVSETSLGSCNVHPIRTKESLILVSMTGCAPDKGWTVREVGSGGRLKTLFEGAFDEGSILARSPDGRHWVTQNRDGTLSVWPDPTR